MLSDQEKAMAEMMAAQFMGKDEQGDPAAARDDAAVKITFFEKDNTVDNSIEGIASRMQFNGCFAIDEYMIQHKDGSPVDAGFGADFNEANGPVAERPREGEIRGTLQWHV